MLCGFVYCSSEDQEVDPPYMQGDRDAIRAGLRNECFLVVRCFVSLFLLSFGFPVCL